MRSCLLMRAAILVAGAWAGLCCVAGANAAESEALANLGRALYFDVNLSAARTQSCATCHDPSRAFTDGRDNGVGAAASLGADGVALGDRNTPTSAYAALTPAFHRDAEGRYVGGFFHDGHAVDLADQAGQPILNPIEMAMPDAAAVVARVRENAAYVASLEQMFGADVFNEVERAFAAIKQCLAAFEQSPLFSPFDSRYDRALRGELELTAQEEIGRALFFSPMTNCTSCHLSDPPGDAARETFTNHRYHNIGIPSNAAVRQKNGLGLHHRDGGLLDHPAVDDPAMAGKFKVPTLRNVAVTGPYMHNGVFHDLRTAIHFYNQFMVRNRDALRNPETGAPWGEAETPHTIDTDLLSKGQPLDEARIDALIAFLRTLTDQRYESLLKN